jgi:hypothetical protein
VHACQVGIFNQHIGQTNIAQACAAEGRVIKLRAT